MSTKKEATLTEAAPVQPATQAGANIPDKAAKLLHAADQTLGKFHNEGPGKTWGELSDAEKEDYRQKAQKAAQADHSFQKIHDDEYAVKIAQGWKFAAVLDVDAKTDPRLIPYNQLPESVRLKNAFVETFIRL